MIHKNLFFRIFFFKQYFFVFHVSYSLALQLQQMKKQTSNSGTNKLAVLKDDVAAFAHFFAKLDLVQSGIPFPIANRSGIYGTNIDNTTITLSRSNNEMTFHKRSNY